MQEGEYIDGLVRRRVCHESKGNQGRGLAAWSWMTTSQGMVRFEEVMSAFRLGCRHHR